MGMVTVDAVSEDPNMWQRPSKIPPDSDNHAWRVNFAGHYSFGFDLHASLGENHSVKPAEITTRLPSI